MHIFIPLLLLSLEWCAAATESKRGLLHTSDSQSLFPRALPNAPDGYTPQGQDCPSTRPSVRNARRLSPNETAWLETRRNNTVQPMRELLGRLNITGFDAVSYINNHANNATALPNIAIAASGGGYRAMLNGAGAIKAFDSREPNTTAAGQIGGLLQSATYLAGLSGGGWLVGSIMVNNFSTIGGLQRGSNASSVWQLGNSIFEGPDKGSIQILDTADYFTTIATEVNDKKGAGFEISLTDYWGRALAFQLINGTDGGVDYTWSSIQLQDSFSSGQAPMPILVADGRAPGETLIPSNTTVFEFNPYEFGTFDPTIFGFVPLEYLGSKFSAGTLPASESCIRGFDNAGFVMGTSSSLFNQFLLQQDSSSLPDLAQKFIANVLTDISNDNNDIADYTPSPFYHYANATNPSANSTRLTLVDGGEDLQNIPLQPLIQPTRQVDVIFAVDSSADVNNFPNGTALVATYERSLPRTSRGDPNTIANGTTFPSIPDVNTFVNLGLNTRPTFFGCNSSNTSSSSPITPIVVYLPNYPYVYKSNIPTFTAVYNNSVRDAVVANGYAVATMGNGSADATWPTCVGCAILSRSMERTGTDVPEVCQACFQNFCWDGKTNSTTPSTMYNPPLKEPSLEIKTSGAAMVASGEKVMGIATAVAAFVGLLSTI